MTQQEFQQRYSYNPATDKLGEGGFGSVFKAYDTHRDRWVALKIAKVNPEYESIRLKREVEMVAQLPSHPNIAYYEACYTFSSFDGEYDFGILQYYAEGNLMQWMRGDAAHDRGVARNAPTEQKTALLIQMLEGVDFLHQNGIIHRDLKPQNILMANRRGEYIPKITDFGISKQLDVNRSSVFSNSIAGAGTLAYASPEQLGDHEIRKNTDLWSFGVIAFQLFTGKLPFNTGEYASTSEEGRMELFRQIKSGQLPKEINSLPEVWQTLVRRCLITDPAQRIKNAREAKDILAGRTETDDGTMTRGHAPLPDTLPQPNGRGVARNAPTETDDDTRIDSKYGIEMVYVQGGAFTMGGTPEQGGDCWDDEKPAHPVTLSDFHIGKYEVTQAQWRAVMGNNPSRFKGDNLPVENVSWNDAQEFIRKLNTQTGKNYRLPTEAEWEYACRGGARSAHYKYSGSDTIGDVAWYDKNSGGKTHPVGTKSPNELGIYDMSGNVWEWCSDWWGNYNGKIQTNPQGPSSGSKCVVRGGNWSGNASYCRVAYRGYDSPDSRDKFLGFRVVLP